MSRLEKIAEKLAGANLPDVDFEAYFKAHDEDKQNVKKLHDYFDDIEEFLDKGHVLTGDSLPFQKLNDLFRFRDGQVTMWSGYNGHMKSMLLGFVALNFIKQGKKVCIASFEMKPLSTIHRMVQHFSHNKDVAENEYADFITHANENFYLFDHQGSMSPDRMCGVILYCAENLGVKHFIIDSLMRVVAGEDKYNEQKDFVVKLCDIAIKTKTHIHLVHHTKKGNEAIIPSRYDSKGSGAISDNVHNSLVVWRNKVGVQGMPDMVLKCDKQREGEWEGSLALTFDKDTMRFNEAFSGVD